MQLSEFEKALKDAESLVVTILDKFRDDTGVEIISLQAVKADDEFYEIETGLSFLSE